MTYSFDTWANHSDNGNMKGLWKKDMPTDSVLLAGAEMDYTTAPFIAEALCQFASNGLFGFTLPDEQYMTSVCCWLSMARNWTVLSESIVPTLGTVFACSTAIRTFTEEGDGVIIQHPSYSRFDRAVRRNNRTVISNPLKEQGGCYEIDFDDLEQKMKDPRAKMMILVNPHNPTGKVFSAEDLKRIADLAARYHVLVFSDEIFAETAQPGHPVTPYAQIDPAFGMTCISLGKAFNLTGVNHANLVIPNPALREPYTVQRDRDHFGSIDPFFYTILKAAYTEEGLCWLVQMNQHTLEHYELLQQAIREEMPLLSLSPLEGTFTAWIDCRRLGLTSGELHAFFEQNALVYPDWGEEYGPGGDGFVRINLASTHQNIEKAIQGLKKAYSMLY